MDANGANEKKISVHPKRYTVKVEGKEEVSKGAGHRKAHIFCITPILNLLPETI
jgi:hypothetical protein